jgi:hypothetical protein
MHLMIMVTGYFIFSCSIINERSEKYEDPSYYQNIKNYSGPTPDHYENFLKIYGNRIISLDQTVTKNPDELRNLYEQRTFNEKVLTEWIAQALKKYNKIFHQRYEFGPFTLHIAERKSKKTLVYVHDNVSSPAFLWDFLNTIAENLDDTNIVVFDQLKVNRSADVFTTEQLNKYFEDGMNYIIKNSIPNTEIYLNVVCHAQLVTNSFVNNYQDKFKQVIYYSPMVKKTNGDKVFDFNNVFSSGEKVDFHMMLYFFNFGEHGYASSLLIPKKHLEYNLETERNLIQSYWNGMTLKTVKNKYLLTAGKQNILHPDSMEFSLFDDDKKFIFKDFKHVDFYANKTKRMIYISKLKEIITQ